MMKNPETDFFIINNLKIYYKIGELECYPPGEDSFLLNKHVKYYCKDKKVLDMGCGTGIQGLEAYRYTKDVTFSDIDENCLKIAKINFYINYIKEVDPKELLEKIDNIKLPVKFVKSNLFEKIDEKFDVILFNPPYLPGYEDDSMVNRWVCGGKDGREVINKFLNNLRYHLNKNGIALLVISSYNKPRELIEDYSKLYEIGVIDRVSFYFEELYLLKIKAISYI